jgi:hypothetical protein
VGDFIRGYPDVVGAGQVDLVDRAILLAPVCELDEGVLLWYFRN